VPLLDLAVLVDHHADARGTLARIDVGAVRRADLPIRVAEEREVEVELLGEGFVGGGVIERDAQDDGVLRVVL
jgi:predicted aspartyl protease